MQEEKKQEERQEDLDVSRDLKNQLSQEILKSNITDYWEEFEREMLSYQNQHFNPNHLKILKR